MVKEDEIINSNIIDRIDKLYEKLEKKKNRRHISVKQVGFGIERICSSTGMPAGCEDKSEDEETKFITRESLVKREFIKSNRDSFDEFIPNGFKLTSSLDYLINGDCNKSYLAVVHIDGNRMGKKFEELKNYFKESSRDGEIEMNDYLNALKKLSDDIRISYEETFKEMCKVISEVREKLMADTKIGEGYFPVRPLIIAGDDICFVANGKIGIDATRIFLEKLQEKKIQTYGEKEINLHACGGVAIVKAKYPFAKAYTLAEELCKNGKLMIIKEQQGEDASLIDWHIDQGELSGGLSEIRKRNYQLKNLHYTMKPIYVGQREEWNRYENFMLSLRNITSSNIAKSKVKNLKDVFRQGEEASKIYIKLNKLDDMVTSRLNEKMGDFGFYRLKDGRNICVYYDALEVIDLFIQLREV